MSDHGDVVQHQFGAQVAVYLSSAVHAQDEEFALLCNAPAGRPKMRILDLGCGTGHVSSQVTALVGEVVAYDLSAKMLVVMAQSAAERGMVSIRTEQDKAESLSFADGEPDFVFSRYFTHYWHDVGPALCEVRWVPKPGGVAIFVDATASGQALSDAFLQTVELLRDTNHVHSYSPAKWTCLSDEAGLLITRSRRQYLRSEFQSWVGRTRTPEVLRQTVRGLRLAVGEEIRGYFEIADDDLFNTDALMLWLRRE